ncbi:hypothetical protein F4810DRAFT_683433 [Camillea tinctor]|nr:hypothetical protein F4810DRAFT_683433 [Camillea tinctor]
MSGAEEVVIEPQTVKELQLLNASLADVDLEITAKHYLLTQSIFAQRQQTISKIPGFWAVAFDNASNELEAAITSDDQEIFAKALTAIELTRPEIPTGAQATDSGLDKFGEPRTLNFKFHFKENEWFTDSVLEKTFYFRYGKDRSSGLVSDPVKINWKPGKDLTEGLTDAAFAFWTAQKNNSSQQLDGVLNNEARHARDKAAKEIPEYKTLSKLLEDKVTGAISFFNFFSYRGRWISAAEHKEAKAELVARRQAAAAGQEEKEEEEDDDDDDEDFTEEEVETFPPGHEVAVTIAEDIWPNAIDYFMDDSIDSDIDLEDDDEDDADVDMEG